MENIIADAKNKYQKEKEEGARESRKSKLYVLSNCHKWKVKQENKDAAAAGIIIK